MWRPFCVTLLFFTDAVVCRPDYLFNREVKGWLKLHIAPATWQQAALNCHYEGAVLASPITAELATALHSIMRQSDVDTSIFLGVNAVTQGDFMSIEGVPLADLSFIWGSYGDGKTPGDCLTLSTDGKTYISSCTLSLPYICYKKEDNTTVLNRCGTFDDDYDFYLATGSCYKYHTKQTWKKAYKICAAEGGYLIIINNRAEADFLIGLLDPPTEQSWGEPTHIGLRDWNQDHTWLSIHGEKLEDLYNKWAKDQPDNRGTFLCGRLWPNDGGTLDDVHCDNDENSFVCEKDPFAIRFDRSFGLEGF